MSYPLTFRFKVLAVARQFSVVDSSDRLLMYVKQKAFKLKESITFYADEEQTRPIYHVAADRIIDFSATYHITDPQGAPIGSIRQKGMRSLWRSHYEILRDGRIVFTATEANPVSKLANAAFESLPVIGVLSGYVFHPRYVVSANGSGPVLVAKKQPAFFESRFEVERLEPELSTEDERLLVIGTALVVLLERGRG